MDSDVRSQNGFLKSLSNDDFQAIRPHLRTDEFPQGQVLQEFGAPMEHVYFPHTCVLSRMLEMDPGESVEVALIGRDSMLGALASTGALAAAKLGAVVLLPGTASFMDMDRLRAAAGQSPALSKAVTRHGHSVLAHSQHSVGCKAMHPVEARLARWLLEVRDLSGSNRFKLTQEMMAQMIGARFNSVSIVVHSLVQAGYITYSDGYVEITNPDGLAQTTCTCYSAIKAQHESLQRETESSSGCRTASH